MVDFTAIGGELGTSTSKFSCEDTIIIFSSVVGDALTKNMEESWRLMNRSSDNRWIKNLAIFDEQRNSWRYVGAMTRCSEKCNWFTKRGLISNNDDAYVSIKAGLFLLNHERQNQGKPEVGRVGFGFGITVRHGENVIEKFFNYMKGRLDEEGGKKFINIKAKNVATNEEKDLKIELDFAVMQYQAYGAYMTILFSKYNMQVYNTYVIDIGHGTWIKLPIVDNEADVNLSDSRTEGIFTITQNISKLIFESSGQKFKIPEQKIMEKLPSKDYKIEVPGVGVFDFQRLLEHECRQLAVDIVEHAINDFAILSQKGHTIDYFTIIGGGAHLLFDTIKEEIGNYFQWPKEIMDKKVIAPASLGIDSRYINCVGFMLLARDQHAIEHDEDVDPNFELNHIVFDIDLDADGKKMDSRMVSKMEGHKHEEEKKAADKKAAEEKKAADKKAAEKKKADDKKADDKKADDKKADDKKADDKKADDKKADDKKADKKADDKKKKSDAK
ncbi:MAG: hypothetical protein ISR65_03135 [Bacteriovoracaceae bacterium]|nr:hypothetical protein [Bacteriovoracaceae bacterium]